MAAGYVRTDQEAPAATWPSKRACRRRGWYSRPNCGMPIIWPAIRSRTCFWIRRLMARIPRRRMRCGWAFRCLRFRAAVSHRASAAAWFAPPGCPTWSRPARRNMSRARLRWPQIPARSKPTRRRCGRTAIPASCSTPTCWSARLENLYRSLCDAHAKGLTPQPDLTNLDAYFDAGIDHDHDGQEVLKIADYHGMYRAKLKRYSPGAAAAPPTAVCGARAILPPLKAARLGRRKWRQTAGRSRRWSA